MAKLYYHVRIDHFDPLLKVNQTDYAYDYTSEADVIDKILAPYLSNARLLFVGKRIKNDNIRSVRIFCSEHDIKTCVKTGDESLGPNSFMVYTDPTILGKKELVPEITTQIFEKASTMNNPTSDEKTRATSKRVFIVHGHDNQTRTEVELMIKELGYEPVVLFKEADRGQTIIEKLERETDDIAFAIVLYSYCDDGKAKEETDLKPRARQNVVFEHGMMVAKIGRSKVVALLEKGVEAPGDLSGVIYKTKDDSGKWKYSIAKEMNAAGLNVDLAQIRD